MQREEIMQRNWVSYLRWWKSEGSDSSKPPTEADFWAWYASTVLDVAPRTGPNVQDIAE